MADSKTPQQPRMFALDGGIKQMPSNARPAPPRAQVAAPPTAQQASPPPSPPPPQSEKK